MLINQLKPVQQSRQLEMIAYFPNVYIDKSALVQAVCHFIKFMLKYIYIPILFAFCINII